MNRVPNNYTSVGKKADFCGLPFLLLFFVPMVPKFKRTSIPAAASETMYHGLTPYNIIQWVHNDVGRDAFFVRTVSRINWSLWPLKV